MQLTGENMSQNKKQLIKFIEEKILKDRSAHIDGTTLLFSTHTLDSMNILDLIGYVEKIARTKISDADLVMSKWRSVDAIVENFLEST